ncbi:MAG: hypothetical protein HY551_03415 [Elusimicrobia bacterium]|nr:hypothetical protein [Elusimicrobiota bacterium]
MSVLIKFILGLLFFLLGLGYLYRPGLIERMNAILRHYLLNDAHIALERRKWGTFFLLLAFLFLYMTYAAMTPRAP